MLLSRYRAATTIHISRRSGSCRMLLAVVHHARTCSNIGLVSRAIQCTQHCSCQRPSLQSYVDLQHGKMSLCLAKALLPGSMFDHDVPAYHLSAIVGHTSVYVEDGRTPNSGVARGLAMVYCQATGVYIPIAFLSQCWLPMTPFKYPKYPERLIAPLRSNHLPKPTQSSLRL